MRNVVAVLVLGLAGTVAADGFKVQPLVGMKAQFGGDTLMTIVYTDNTTQDILAGQGIDFYAGAQAVSAPYSAKASIGYKYSTSMATNIDVEKTALPFNLTARYNVAGDVFLGAGLTKHFSPQLSVDGVVAEFDSSVGYHVEAGWKMISVGYTSINYSQTNGSTFDASTFDVNIEFAF